MTGVFLGGGEITLKPSFPGFLEKTRKEALVTLGPYSYVTTVVQSRGVPALQQMQLEGSCALIFLGAPATLVSPRH